MGYFWKPCFAYCSQDIIIIITWLLQLLSRDIRVIPELKVKACCYNLWYTENINILDVQTYCSVLCYTLYGILYGAVYKSYVCMYM